MKFAVRNLVLGLLVSMAFAGSASAQYMKLVSDNSDPTKMRSSGTTVLTFMINSNHDRDGSLQTCNSHTAALGCGTATSSSLDLGSFTLTLTAVGGTVTWGAFTTAGSTTSAVYADLNGGVALVSPTQIELDYGRASGFDTPGLYTMGSIPVTPTSGNPSIEISFGTQPVNPSGFGTGFGTECDGSNFANTYVLGNPADLCGSFGDFSDTDGVARGGVANNPPTLTQPTDMTVNEGATADQAITGSDPDADPLTFSLFSGPSFVSVTTVDATHGNIHLAPGFSDAGTPGATVSASDGTASSLKSITITVNNVNRAPALSQPSAMVVAENATADQTLNGTDPDGDVLTFTKVAGPTYLTVTTVDASHGNARLAPGFSDAGSAAATVRASDGSLTDDKPFTITVANTNRPPTLNQPTDMTVPAGSTADQVITGSDPDGTALTFSLVSGPTYASVTTTNPTTGNIHLAPAVADVGSAAATVRATDGGLNSDKSLTITVTAGNRAPTLNQPANMTVNEGATADQVITGTDPDGDPIAFTKVAGPTYLAVTTTNATTGNIHLAPGFSDAGTAAATVQASDGSLTDSKTLTVTVNNVNRAPTLDQPVNMTVNEGATADQVITGTDPDGDALTFSLVLGPSFMSVTTTNATSGNIHLAPGFSDAGTARATVRASDGSLTNDKSLTITVNNTNRAPILNQPANMTVAQGATADQVITGTDPDGDALTFSKVAGPTFMTVSTTNATTGNIHLAAGALEPIGVTASSVRTTDGSLNSATLPFTVTVTATNHAPVLAQPADMTVNEGATADQTLNATDSDGDVLAFSLVSGPTYASVTTTTPGTGTATGNIHLAPGFSDAGTAGATVRASDGSLTNDKSLTITVNNTNRAPALNAITNMTVTEGATADQTITASDPDGDALTFSKVTGPTFLTVSTTNATTGNVHVAPLTGDAAGSPYTVQARVSDGTLTDTRIFSVTIRPPNRAPALAQPADMTVDEGATADQTLHATDQDGDPVTFTLVSGPTYASVTTTAPGTGTATGNIHLAPGFSDAGTAGATVRASDGSLTNDKSLTITVNDVNRAPTLTQPTNVSVAQGTTADQVLTGTDPDGDALTFSLVSGPTFASVTTTTPTTGNIHLAAGGLEPLGTSGATVRASDGSLNSDKSLTITVTGTNHAPVLAQPADMTVDEGATADQTLNATDPDGDPLTFSLVSGPGYASVTTTTAGTGTATGNIHLAPGFSDAGTAAATVRASDGSLNSDKSLTITVNDVNRAPTLNQPTNMSVAQGTTADQVLTGTDPDGDALTFSLVSGPSFASVTTTTPTTGNIHLAAGALEPLGTSGATVRASDGSLNSDKSLTITVTGTNHAPVLAQPADMTVDEGATADQTLNATDPDGDALAFSLVSGPTYASVTTTAPGTGTATGNIHLAPGFSDAGTAAATVRASDGSLNSDKSLTITVNDVNRAPTLTQPTNMSVAQGTTADQVLTGTDPDGDALTFSLVSGPSFASVTTTTPTTGNIHLAAGAAEPLGTSGATVRASDGSLNSDKSLTITVTATNHAPVLAQPANMTVNEGDTADQTLNATDQDGDPLTFSLVSGPAYASVTTTTAGTGTATGNIHLAPGFSDAGTAAATVRASDGSLTSDKSLTITVNNTNRAPTLNAIADMTVAEGATANQTITGSDPDGDALTFSKATGPTFLTVSTTNGTTGNVHLAPIAGDAAGSPYSASASASDGALSDTKGFTITVTAVQQNHAPTLTQPANMTVNEGATADQTLTASDQDGDAVSFTKVGGPTFLTVGTLTPTTGNAHLAPGFADAGTYGATVRASDGSLFDDKSFTITVNNVNRAPVADAGGPYAGVVGVPVAFDGTHSSDPDGNSLTYAWDFDSSNGITADATGPTPSHTYAATGTFTVTLTVTDDDAVPLSNTDTATADIAASNGFLANAFIDGGDRVIRLKSFKPFWCLDLAPANHSFRVTDIIPSSILATFNGTSIHSISGTHVDDGRLEVCFSKDQLRILFASLPNGRRIASVSITGRLTGGGSFHASLDVAVEKSGGPGSVSKDDEDGHGHDAFAFASPNPLNPSTTISFVLSRPGSVSLNVYDVSGRLVKTLANEFMGTGPHMVGWDGTSRQGARVASGVYFYVLQTPELTVKSHLVVAK